MIDRQAENIIEILKKEHSYYKDLLELSNKKKAIVVEGKISELDKIVKLEQNMIFDLGQLEKQREQELQKLCQLMNIDSKTTITDLSKVLPAKISKQLVALQKEMEATITELQNVNNINGQLIQQSLDYIDYTVNMVTSAGTASSLYDDLKPSNQNVGNKKRLFDTKI